MPTHRHSRRDHDNSEPSPSPAVRRPTYVTKKGTATYAAIPQVVLSAVMSARISGAAFKVWLAVAQWWYQFQDDNRKQPVSFTYKELAAATGLSTRAVINAVDELERGALLGVLIGCGKNHRNAYTIPPASVFARQPNVNNRAPFKGEQEAEETVNDSPANVNDRSPYAGQKVNESVAKGEVPERGNYKDADPAPLSKQSQTLPDETLRHETTQQERLGGTDTKNGQQGKNGEGKSSESSDRESESREPTKTLDPIEGFFQDLSKPLRRVLSDSRYHLNGKLRIKFRYPAHRDVFNMPRNRQEWQAAAEHAQVGAVELLTVANDAEWKTADEFAKWPWEVPA